MRVPDTDESALECVCPTCPTYNECMGTGIGMGEQRLFCSRGRTGCALEREGCICDSCAVWERFGLERGYFCADGSADEVMGEA